MKSYTFKRKYKKEKKQDESNNNSIKEISKTYKIDTGTNNEIQKKLSDEKKEKYKFRKREKKVNHSEKKEIKNNKNIESKVKSDEKKESKKNNKFKEDLNEIERICTGKVLKKDLMELYEKVLENNLEFRDKIFFKNLLDTEKKIGKMDSIDREQISHTFKEIETKNILKNIENSDSLIRKYITRAKRIYDED